MEIQQIESFIQVAKEMNFSKAAEHMHITQSTMSARIKKLENTLGVQLFKRTGRHVQLTNYGQIFLPYAEECFEAVNLGKKRLDDEQKHNGDRLRIGVTNPFSTYMLPHVLPDLYSQFPDINFQIVSMLHSEDVLSMLNDSQIDLGVVNHIGKMDNIVIDRTQYLTLYDSPLILVANQLHELCQFSEVPTEKINEYKFIYLSPKTSIYKLTKKFFKDHEITPESFIEINSVAAAKEVIKTANLLTLLPKLIVTGEITAGQLIELPLPTATPSLVTSLVYSKRHQNQELLHFIKEKVSASLPC